MLRTFFILAGLLGAATANASGCPANRTEIRTLVSSMDIVDTQEISSSETMKQYRPDRNVRVLGVTPNEVRTWGYQDGVDRMEIRFGATDGPTSVAFEAAYPRSTCDADSKCEDDFCNCYRFDAPPEDLQYVYWRPTKLVCDYEVEEPRW